MNLAETQDLNLIQLLDDTVASFHAKRMNEEALSCLEQSMQLKKKMFGMENDGTKRTFKEFILECNTVAMGCLRDNELARSVELIRKAEKLLENINISGIESLRVLTYSNLGCCYRKLGKLKQALKYLQLAADIGSYANTVSNLSVTHLNICAIQSQLNRHGIALEHARSAVFHCQEELVVNTVHAHEEDFLNRDEMLNANTEEEKMITLAVAYHNLAVELEFSKLPQDSLQWYKKSYGIARKYREKNYDLYKAFKHAYSTARKNFPKWKDTHNQQEKKIPKPPKTKDTKRNRRPSTTKSRAKKSKTKTERAKATTGHDRVQSGDDNAKPSINVGRVKPPKSARDAMKLENLYQGSPIRAALSSRRGLKGVDLPHPEQSIDVDADALDNEERDRVLKLALSTSSFSSQPAIHVSIKPLQLLTNRLEQANLNGTLNTATYEFDHKTKVGQRNSSQNSAQEHESIFDNRINEDANVGKTSVVQTIHPVHAKRPSMTNFTTRLAENKYFDAASNRNFDELLSPSTQIEGSVVNSESGVSAAKTQYALELESICSSTDADELNIEKLVSELDEIHTIASIKLQSWFRGVYIRVSAYWKNQKKVVVAKREKDKNYKKYKIQQGSIRKEQVESHLKQVLLLREMNEIQEISSRKIQAAAKKYLAMKNYSVELRKYKAALTIKSICLGAFVRQQLPAVLSKRLSKAAIYHATHHDVIRPLKNKSAKILHRIYVAIKLRAIIFIQAYFRGRKIRLLAYESRKIHAASIIQDAFRTQARLRLLRHKSIQDRIKKNNDTLNYMASVIQRGYRKMQDRYRFRCAALHRFSVRNLAATLVQDSWRSASFRMQRLEPSINNVKPSSKVSHEVKDIAASTIQSSWRLKSSNCTFSVNHPTETPKTTNCIKLLRTPSAESLVNVAHSAAAHTLQASWRQFKGKCEHATKQQDLSARDFDETPAPDSLLDMSYSEAHDVAATTLQQSWRVNRTRVSKQNNKGNFFTEGQEKQQVMALGSLYALQDSIPHHVAASTLQSSWRLYQAGKDHNDSLLLNDTFFSLSCGTDMTALNVAASTLQQSWRQSQRYRSTPLAVFDDIPITVEDTGDDQDNDTVHRRMLPRNTLNSTEAQLITASTLQASWRQHRAQTAEKHQQRKLDAAYSIQRAWRSQRATKFRVKNVRIPPNKVLLPNDVTLDASRKDAMPPDISEVAVLTLQRHWKHYIQASTKKKDQQIKALNTLQNFARKLLAHKKASGTTVWQKQQKNHKNDASYVETVAACTLQRSWRTAAIYRGSSIGNSTSGIPNDTHRVEKEIFEILYDPIDERYFEYYEAASTIQALIRGYRLRAGKITPQGKNLHPIFDVEPLEHYKFRNSIPISIQKLYSWFMNTEEYRCGPIYDIDIRIIEKLGLDFKSFRHDFKSAEDTKAIITALYGMNAIVSSSKSYVTASNWSSVAGLITTKLQNVPIWNSEAALATGWLLYEFREFLIENI